jgi:uncharacterized protein
MTANNILVGVISDTHGLLRAEAVQALRGSDLILHAGDVGQPDIIGKLREIAPVFSVRGNIDTGDWAAKLPLRQTVAVGDVMFYLLHNQADLDLDPGAAGFSAVVCGHSHQPSITRRGDVLFLNPGSAGPRRFRLPVTVARVRVSGRQLAPEIITLDA